MKAIFIRGVLLILLRVMHGSIHIKEEAQYTLNNLKIAFKTIKTKSKNK